jgi:hypothetical protein
MTIFILLLGFVIGTILGWRLGRWRTFAALSRTRQAMAAEIEHWQAAAARANTKAAKATEEARMWAEGCRQGREDVISIVPLLIAAQRRAADDQWTAENPPNAS